LLADYGYIALFLLVAVAFTFCLPLLALVLSLFGVSPKKPNPIKSSTYECGLETFGRSWVQFNFRYYFYALLFVVFDVLTIFLYPWAVSLKQLHLFGFVAMVIFIGIIFMGYFYAWKKRALEWK
jgi:NADH-quinone oxidoreductase subunit A